MTKVILFPQDSGTVAIMTPTGALDPMQTAIKDVPAGVPFIIIIDATDIPQGVPQEALVVDFSEPDGFGTAGGHSE